MLLRVLCLTATLVPVFAQSPAPAPRHESQPVYRITIVQRTTPAINYSHRSEPTKVDFRGTPLLPQARGEVTVESKRGAALIDARFDRVPAPTRFGTEYLTYVVWAVSPEGRAQNLGELVVNGSDKGRLRASTQMQAFALLVTAEPYFSVTQPSDVVVMENAVRPETVGKVEQVDATYELLQRKEYTYNYASARRPAPSAGAPVSMDEYEAVTAVFQAKSAIEIASAAGADRYAPERLARAEALFDRARHLPLKRLNEEIVATAREAAQIAEDARVIALRRADDDRISKERAQLAQAKKETEMERATAQVAIQQAQMEADRAKAETARVQAAAEQARQQVEMQPRAVPQSSSADRMRIPPPDDPGSTRARLLGRLKTAFETQDTPRGLVVIIPDSMLESAGGMQRVRGRLDTIASAMKAYPGLRYEVAAHTDTGKPESASFSVTQSLAARVREMLVMAGLPPALIVAQAYGSSRPVASNSTAAGRQQNRRVEIVISGQAIGTQPAWDRTYSLKPR